MHSFNSLSPMKQNEYVMTVSLKNIYSHSIELKTLMFYISLLNISKEHTGNNPYSGRFKWATFGISKTVNPT